MILAKGEGLFGVYGSLYCGGESFFKGLETIFGVGNWKPFLRGWEVVFLFCEAFLFFGVFAGCFGFCVHVSMVNEETFSVILLLGALERQNMAPTRA